MDSKTRDDVIDRAKYGNPIICKYHLYHPHNDNPNFGISDKEQELFNQVKVANFIEKENSKSPTPPSNPTSSLINYKKPTIEIEPGNIDQSQYQNVPDRSQPGPSNSTNKPNTYSHTGTCKTIICIL
jgi:hypothetical protein